MMDNELLDSIDNYMSTPFDNEINLKGIPATDEDIILAESILGIKFHEDYLTFIKIFGGAYIGIDIYAFKNNEMMSNGVQLRFVPH